MSELPVYIYCHVRISTRATPARCHYGNLVGHERARGAANATWEKLHLDEPVVRPSVEPPVARERGLLAGALIHHPNLCKVPRW